MIREIIKHIKSLKIRYYLPIFFLTSYLHVSSQDIKMSYMQINWLSGYTYADTTYLLTDINTDVNRPYILINWDVKIDTSWLIQTTVTNIGILKKYYSICNYPGPGYYLIKYQDSFRIANIKNVSQSDNESIELTTLLKIPTLGSLINSAPILQNKNISLSLQNDSVIFKPQFYDTDGDSLSFQLTSCFATNYYLPNGVSMDIYGNVSFSKDSLGIYAFSLIIKEWRNNDDGTKINTQSSQLDFTMNITTDVSLVEMNKLAINIYPNPTNSILKISDEQNELQNSTITIKDNLGQSVFYSPFTSQIDLSGLSAGMYFLTLDNGVESKTVKIIKQ